jgi:RecB family exonuclease
LLARLDEAWGGLEFPAAWQAAAELDGARSALARYDAYRRAGFREVSAVEAGVDYTVEAGGPVRVRGRIDRIVRDRRGASWVVDFKTGGTAPARAQAARNLQLGLYQLALQTAAAEPVAGAELVFLRLPDTRGSAYPKVLAQASLADQPYLAGSAPLPVADARVVVVGDQRDYPTWVHYRLAAAAAVVRQGTYPALPGPPCRGCAFTRGCPGRGEA